MTKKLINTQDTPTFLSSREEGLRTTTHGTQDCVSKYVSYVCQKCNKTVTERDVSFLRNIDMTCGPCKRRATSLERHGSETWNNPRRGNDNPSKRLEVREKISKANRGNTKGLEQRRTTCLEKYGVDNAANSEVVRQKTIETSLERYGVEVPSKSDSVKERAKATCLARYGEVAPTRNKEIQDKVIKTNIERYGVDNPSKSQEIKNKIVQTFMDRYGVRNPSQSEELFHPWRDIVYEGEHFDSSWEVAYWISKRISGDTIERNRKSFDLPSGRKCFPDFIVNGQLVEIKGDYLKSYDTWTEKKAVYDANDVRVISYEEIYTLMDDEVRSVLKENGLPVPAVPKRPRIGAKTLQRKPEDRKPTKKVFVLYGPKRSGKSTTTEIAVSKLKDMGYDFVWVHGDRYVDSLDTSWMDVAEYVIFENHSWNKMIKMFPGLPSMDTFYLEIDNDEFLRRARSSMVRESKKTDVDLLKNKWRKDRKGHERCKAIVSTSDELVSGIVSLL